MGKIALEELEFFAKHGVYKEERIIGNRYRVDVEIDADLEKAALSDNVKDTIDYGQVYKIVEVQVHQPAKLLEHLAGNILIALLKEIPKIDALKVVVHKYNAPIGGICKWAKVTLSKTREEFLHMQVQQKKG